MLIKKRSTNGMIFCLILMISLMTAPALAEEAAVNTEGTAPAQTPAENSDKPSDSEEEEISPRYDPKHQQYLKGKLAYWFQDYGLAMQAWLPLAEEGIAHAEASVGWLYHNGYGVKQDYEKAVEWYQKSADQDYVIGQHNLGIMYENGWGVEQDYQQAKKWYELAANQAYGLSLYNLGLLYANGLGVDVDKDKAVHLLKQAYILKVDEAWTALDQMGVKIEKRKVRSHAPVTPRTHAPMTGTLPESSDPANE